MNLSRSIFPALILLAGPVSAYNSEHGPFAEDAQIERIPLTKLAPEIDPVSTNHPRASFLFVPPGAEDTRLLVSCEPSAKFIQMTMRGREVLRKTEFSQYPLIAEITASFADLNGDRIRDYVVFSHSGGCGLSSGLCNVAFLLSSGTTYRLTVVATLFPDPGDFVLIRGKPCFVQTSFRGAVGRLDGKRHNFWIYTLLAFAKDSLEINNGLNPEFPKIVWYTDKPNHRETTILRRGQKDELLEASRAEIFWQKGAGNEGEATEM
jgi:hypothetical protein